MNLYLHPIILFNRGLLASTFARASVALAYVFLFWLNLRYPDPASVEGISENPDYLSEIERRANACPALPLKTEAKVGLVTRIATEEEPDFPSLWEACENNPDLETIVLEQWISSDPSGALEKSAETHLDLYSWRLFGEQKGAEAWKERGPLKWGQSESLLAGIAKSDPQFVIKLIEQNPRLSSGAILSGILDGLAKTDPTKALDFEISKGFPHYDEPGDRSFDYSENLAKWARQSPDKAFDWVWQNQDLHWHLSFLISEIARSKPQLIRNAIDQLPTGATKKAFQNGLGISREKKERAEYHPSQTGSNRNPTSLLTALNLATSSFSDEWPDLMRGSQFNDLGEARKSFLISVIRERWIDYNPMGYADIFGFRNVDCIARWLEIDQDGAFRKLEFLTARKDQQAEVFFKTIIEATSRRDMGQALALLASPPKYVKGVSVYEYQEVLRRLARHDREALLTSASSHVGWNIGAQAAAIEVWKEEDLPWCLAKCADWNKEYLISDLRDSDLEGMPLMRNFDALPSKLRKRILQIGEHDMLFDLDWLLEPPPTKIDEESLDKLRSKQSSWRYWYQPKDFAKAAEVIGKCHFIEAQIRSEIAVRVIESHDIRELKRAEKWLEKIPDKFSKQARQRLEERKKELATKPQKEINTSPILKALKITSADRCFLEYRNRPLQDYDEILDGISRLPSNQCVELIKDDGPPYSGFYEFHELLVEIQKALIENALKSESNRNDYILRDSAQRMIISWAKDEPARATKWAEALPHGKVRDACIQKAFRYWTTWDLNEAKTWGDRLSPRDRKIVSLR